LFDEIDSVDQRKYKGKFVVFYKRERLGRLFDFFEGRAKKYLFDFGQPVGEVSTDKLADIDKMLLAVFILRVGDGDPPVKKSQSIKGAVRQEAGGQSPHGVSSFPLSLRLCWFQPDASASVILVKKFDIGIFKRGNDCLDGTGLCRQRSGQLLKALDRRQ
jgi:hypothetical protein